MSEQKCYPTPHIGATPEDFGKTVLMPGDPRRSEFVARNFLEGATLFNNVRGVQGYTGTWRGTPISVMASGMGMPSMGIYSYELYNFFDIDNILRIGSAGGLREDVKLRQIVLGMGASTDSAYAEQYHFGGTFAPLADYGMLRVAADVCAERGVAHHVGNLISTDVFYNDDFSINESWKRMGILAVEMEAAALYMNAARAGKKALAICTVSDHLFSGEKLSVEERQCGFTDMMEIALETAWRLESEAGRVQQ